MKPSARFPDRAPTLRRFCPVGIFCSLIIQLQPASSRQHPSSPPRFAQLLKQPQPTVSSQPNRINWWVCFYFYQVNLSPTPKKPRLRLSCRRLFLVTSYEIPCTAAPLRCGYAVHLKYLILHHLPYLIFHNLFLFLFFRASCHLPDHPSSPRNEAGPCHFLFFSFCSLPLSRLPSPAPAPTSTKHPSTKQTAAAPAPQLQLTRPYFRQLSISLPLHLYLFFCCTSCICNRKPQPQTQRSSNLTQIPPYSATPDARGRDITGDTLHHPPVFQDLRPPQPTPAPR